MVENFRYDGFGLIDRLEVPTTSRRLASTSPPIGTTPTSSPSPGQGSEKSQEQSDRGVTVLPLISLTADGEGLLLVARGKEGEQHTFPVLCFGQAAAKAKEAKQHMPWRWFIPHLAGRVRAGLLWLLGGRSNGPQEVRVRVDVVVTRRTIHGPPPEVRVRVEPASLPPGTTLLPPEVKVKVEPLPTPSRPTSSETAD